MEENLETLFKKIENKFDIEEPTEGHTERFLEKLQASDTLVKTNNNRKSWIRPLAIAASVAVLLAAGFAVLKYKTSTEEQLAEISPEAANTELYFASLVEEQVKLLQKESTPETKRMVDDTMSQLQKLNLDYKKLEKDLLEGGNSKMILSAMITNFQTRIDLLKDVLIKIETIKNFKKSNDENYTI